MSEFDSWACACGIAVEQAVSRRTATNNEMSPASINRRVLPVFLAVLCICFILRGSPLAQ